MIVYGFCITWISKDRDFTGLTVFNSVFRISIHLANKTRIGRCSVGMCMQTNDVLCDRTTSRYSTGSTVIFNYDI